MAREQNIRGFSNGRPIYDVGVPKLSSEEKKARLRSILDIIEDFPNGKSFFEYDDGKYFEIDSNGNAIVDYIVRLDAEGNVTSRENLEY